MFEGLSRPWRRILVAALNELQQRIAIGDESAFTQLYLLYGKRLIQFAYSLVRSRESAEELVEDVYVKVWANRSTITSIDNLTVYLYVSVKNKSLNLLSQKARELITAPFDFLDSSTDSFVNDPYNLLITAEMMNRMQEAIDALPPRCKMIFKLIREDGLKYKEVAEILNISINTIDAQMAIAVRRICTALDISKSLKARSGNPVSPLPKNFSEKS